MKNNSENPQTLKALTVCGPPLHTRIRIMQQACLSYTLDQAIRATQVFPGTGTPGIRFPDTAGALVHPGAGHVQDETRNHGHRPHSRRNSQSTSCYHSFAKRRTPHGGSSQSNRAIVSLCFTALAITIFSLAALSTCAYPALYLSLYFLPLSIIHDSFSALSLSLTILSFSCVSPSLLTFSHHLAVSVSPAIIALFPISPLFAASLILCVPPLALSPLLSTLAKHGVSHCFPACPL